MNSAQPPPRRRRHHDRIPRIAPPHAQAFIRRPSRLRRLPRNRQPQLESKVRRFLHTAHARQQLLRLPQRPVLPHARGASVQVRLQRQHLGSRDCSIQVGRQQSLRGAALHRRPRRNGLHGHILHGITSTLLPPPATCDRKLVCSSSGALSPNSPPTSRTKGASLCFSACRPRVNLDFTVPSEICNTSAISSYDMSSRSRRISVLRYGSGICRSSASTRFCTSQCATLSNGQSPQSVSAFCIAAFCIKPSPFAKPSDSNGSIEVSCALCRNHHRFRFAASCSAIR